MPKFFKKTKTNTGGFLLVEVLVAVAIISASILASMAVAQRSVYIARQAVHTGEAAYLAEEGAEAMRILRDNSWSNISGLVSGTDYYLSWDGSTWSTSTTPGSVGIFTRKINILPVSRDNATADISSSGTDDPGTKEVTVTVSWQEGGTLITKTLSFYLFNIFS